MGRFMSDFRSLTLYVIHHGEWTATFGRIGGWAVWIACWVWAIIAGGGGLLLLIQKGPWPPTNGWFALFSGLFAWPPSAFFLRRLAGIAATPRIQVAAAIFFLIA